MSGPLQIGWTSFLHGVSFSKSPAAVYRRFWVTRNTTDYTVSDKEQKDCARVHTLAAAHAWAGVRVGEQNVRHGRMRE